MNETNETNERINSVEYSVTSKGMVSCKIKVYDETGQKAYDESLRLLEIARAYCDKINNKV